MAHFKILTSLGEKTKFRIELLHNSNATCGTCICLKQFNELRYHVCVCVCVFVCVCVYNGKEECFSISYMITFI